MAPREARIAQLEELYVGRISLLIEMFFLRRFDGHPSDVAHKWVSWKDRWIRETLYELTRDFSNTVGHLNIWMWVYSRKILTEQVIA
ncbi:hypothetical protein SuNHUV7_25840 (plasmid) [Pseudoseohaeicola sp. NH-UV-7]